MKDFKVHREEPDAVQVEWKGILLTIQLNKFHGLSGSVAQKKDGKTLLLEFHGKHPEQMFPLTFHEGKL